MVKYQHNLKIKGVQLRLVQVRSPGTEPKTLLDEILRFQRYFKETNFLTM